MLAQAAADQARRVLQYLVADRMAVGVIDVLEVVDVDHQQRTPARRVTLGVVERGVEASRKLRRFGSPVSGSVAASSASRRSLLRLVMSRTSHTRPRRCPPC